MRPGAAVIVSSVRLPNDPSIIMPSLVYTLPGTTTPTTQTVADVPMTDVNGLPVPDVVALMQARFQAATSDIVVLLQLTADSTLEFSERHERPYKLKWKEEANSFWNKEEPASGSSEYILAYPTPLSGPAEHIMTNIFPHFCRDADGRAAHSTTLYGKPGTQDDEKVLLLFATKGEATREYVTSKCLFHSLVDIGPHASPLYDDSGRLFAPLRQHHDDLSHQISWRNRHFAKVAKPFADLLRSYSPLGTGSDVPLRPAQSTPTRPSHEARAGHVMDMRRANSGPEVSVFIPNTTPEPPSPPATVYMHFTESVDKDVGVIVPAPVTGDSRSAASDAEAQQQAFEITEDTYLELDEASTFGEGGTVSFARPHELESGDIVHLERAPSSERSPYATPAMPTIPHFFDSHPKGAPRDGRFAVIAEGPAEGVGYRVRKINSLDIALERPSEATPPTYSQVDLSAARTRMALSEDAGAGDEQGSVRVVRHLAVSSHNRAWDTAYVEISGLSGEGHSSMSTDINMTRSGSLVVPVSWQLGDQLLRPLVSASVRNPDRKAVLTLSVAGADGVTRPARFPDAVDNNNDVPDLIRVDVVVTITRPSTNGAQRYDRLQAMLHG